MQNKAKPRYEKWTKAPRYDSPLKVDIAKLIAAGFSDKMIAAELGLTYKGIVGHKASMRRQMGCHTDGHLVAEYFRFNLIS